MIDLAERKKELLWAVEQIHEQIQRDEIRGLVITSMTTSGTGTIKSVSNLSIAEVIGSLEISAHVIRASIQTT